MLPSGEPGLAQWGPLHSPAPGRRLSYAQEPHRQQLQTTNLFTTLEAKGNGQTQNVLSALGQTLSFEVSGSLRDARPVSQEQDWPLKEQVSSCSVKAQSIQGDVMSKDEV